MAHKESDAKDIDTLDAEMASVTAAMPEAMAEANARRMYWIKGARSTLIQTAIEWVVRETKRPEVGAGAAIYKLLSWDEHHVMATLLSIDTARDSKTFGAIKRQDAPEDPSNYIAMLAVGALFGMLNLYTMLFPETLARLAPYNVRWKLSRRSVCSAAT